MNIISQTKEKERRRSESEQSFPLKISEFFFFLARNIKTFVIKILYTIPYDYKCINGSSI